MRYFYALNTIFIKDSINRTHAINYFFLLHENFNENSFNDFYSKNNPLNRQYQYKP